MSDPTLLMAQVLTLVGEISVSVTDSFSTRTITLVAAAATKYGRVYLAPTAAAGTLISAPLEVLNTFETLLNAAVPGNNYWAVRMTASGAVKITYNGGAGTGTITWTANGTGLRNILGFTGTVGPLAVAASTTGTYAPGGCIVSLCAGEDDSHWQSYGGNIAAASTADGRTIALDTEYQSVRRTLRLRMVPHTQSEATSEIRTPCFPLETTGNSTRWTTPTTTGYLLDGAYSVHQFLATAHRTSADARVAMMIGTFQTQLVASSPTYVLGSITADALKADEKFPLSVPGYYRWHDVNLTLALSSFEARS